MKFYPMPLFVKLSVGDFERSINWYKSVLNFESVIELPGENGKIVMAHIRGKKYQDIMLVAEQNEKQSNGKGVVLNFSVDDVDVFFRQSYKG